MIALGLVFFGGQLAHAHNQELRDAESLIDNCPTIENHKRLYDLYMDDVKFHLSQGQNYEAIKSMREAQYIQDIIGEMVAKEAPKIIDKANEAEQYARHKIQKGTPSWSTILSLWEKAEACWNEAAKLYTWANMQNNVDFCTQKLSILKFHIASSKMCKAINELNDDTRHRKINNNKFYSLANSWDEVIKLADDVNKAELACNCRTPFNRLAPLELEATFARAHHWDPIIYNNETKTSYERSLPYWNKSLELAQECKKNALLISQLSPDKRKAYCYLISPYTRTPKEYNNIIYLAKLKILEIRAQILTSEQLETKPTENYYKNMANSWDELANVYDDDHCFFLNTSFIEKAIAAQEKQIKMDVNNYNKIITDINNKKNTPNNKTATSNENYNPEPIDIVIWYRKAFQNYKILIQYWNHLATQYEKRQWDLSVKEARANEAKVRAEQASLTANFYGTPNNYEDAVQYWDTVATLFKDLNDKHHIIETANLNIEELRIKQEKAIESDNIMLPCIKLIMSNFTI